MKKINSIYIIAIGLVFVLYAMNNSIQSESAFFYGFAENKETEISHDNDVLIEKIMVTTGQKVQQGDLLMVVKNTALPVKISELELKKEAVSIDVQQKIREIKNEITALRLEKVNKLNLLNEKITELQKKIELSQSLYEGLKSIKIKPDSTRSVEQMRLDYLKESLTVTSQNYDSEIAFKKELLLGVNQPSRIKHDILNTEIEHYKEAQSKLSICAPTDGIIGYILCKKGENIPAFSTLLNFYQVNPTLVKGYIHESLLLKVKKGDKLEVSSSLHPTHKVQGEVIGLGSRIVEIPERLRKIQDLKTYGREVLIKIPPDNNLLQNEKVMLNATLHGEQSVLTSLFSFR